MKQSSFWQTLPRPITILAPMEDVTDVVFRDIIHRAGPPMVYVSEFTAAGAVLQRKTEALRRLEFNERHRPMVAQIWGNRPEEYFAVVRELHRRGFDGVDINMGCPTRKIIARGACSALINNQSLAAELIAAAREGAESAFAEYGDSHEGPPGRVQCAMPLPVSVKTRIGFKDVQVDQWCGFLLNQELALLTVHGRTSVQQSDGMADWREIQRAVSIRNRLAPETLLIGNGDLREFSQFAEYPRRYGVDGVMVGRGIFENPFMFRNARFHDLPGEEQVAWALEHLDEYRRVYEGRRNFEVMKKFFKIYLTEFEGAEKLQERIMAVHSYDDAEFLLREFSNTDRAALKTL